MLLELGPIVDRVSNDGATPLAVIDRQPGGTWRVLGVIRLKVTVKPGMKERFDEMRAMGIRTVMITVDNPLAAAAIAREADIGVAMNTGTQAATEAGNMVDLDSNPTKLIEIVEVGKQLLVIALVPLALKGVKFRAEAASAVLRRNRHRPARVRGRGERLGADVAVPVDAVTASGSGLDPHISIANARLQARRVSEARGLTLDVVMALIGDHTDGRSLGVLGEPGVNVVPLNLALDYLAE